MSLLKKIRRHWRHGTIIDAVKGRLGLLSQPERVKWHGARTPAQAAYALAKHAGFVLADKPVGSSVLTLGDGNPFHDQLNRWLQVEGIPLHSERLEAVAKWSAAQAQDVALVVSGYPDMRRTTEAARALAKHPALGEIPYEYVAGLDQENASFNRLDDYRDTCFVSPLLLDEPSPYALYEESLRHFEQKCGLRDYLDLYQLLKWVVRAGIPGDIAEFGSYKGHSGWLIARSLQALGSDKRLFMFDTFDRFPDETLGLDRFWSHTHPVVFEEVRAKLAPFERIHLVKGDFTQTLASSGLEKIALAYVDCDSYRATRFLFDALLQGPLGPSGILVCEDYGHPALLGNRLAVHDSLGGRPEYFQFFSQFSGLYVVVKPAATAHG